MKILYNNVFVVLLLFVFFPVVLFSQYSISNQIDATNGLCNGQIEVSVDSDNAPHSFLWSNGETSQNISDLCPDTYSVTITDGNGCEWDLSSTIGGSGGCYINSETFNVSIQHYCESPPGGSIRIEHGSNLTYLYNWDNGATTNFISGLIPGDYCVTVMDINVPNCMTTMCYKVNALSGCNEGQDEEEGLIIVNEISNGASGSKEYIELLVKGNNSCDPVDIRGYIIDDNNGDFSNPSYGISNTGISGGHNRFKDIERWAAVDPGSIILIYNPSDKNTSITLPDDPDDSDGDLIYILPITNNGFEGTSQYPSSSNPYTYPENISYSNPSWSYLVMNNSRDAVQVRKPDGSYCHGISYGGTSYMSGGPGDLHVRPYSATKKVIFLDVGLSTYETETANSSNETPGASNSISNESIVQTFKCDPNANPTLIVNEFSNGGSGISEYVEILVLGDKDSCAPVDIRGYIIDDNNGDFSLDPVGSGIAVGHLRFPATAVWSSVPVGSLIVIYNEQEKNSEIGEDDPFDGDGDGVYIIPASSLEGSDESPTVSGQGVYSTNAIYGIGEWSTCWMYNSGDAIQIRFPDGSYCHGISYGNSGKISGGPDSLFVEDKTGTGKVYSFHTGSGKNVFNYSADKVSDGYQTPGAPNNPENEAFIQNFCGQSRNLDIRLNPSSDAVSNAKLYPNPFEFYFKLDIEMKKATDIEFQIIDSFGRRVLTGAEAFSKGINSLRIESEEKFSNGVYYLILMSEGESIYEQKIICLR